MQIHDARLGRVSLQMVERTGVVNATVRTDSARGAQLISESLPGLLETLAQRGLEHAPPGSGAGAFGSSRDPHDGQHQGRGRQPRHPERQERRRGRTENSVFRLALG